MKILHVLAHMNIGGAQVTALNIAEWLPEFEHIFVSTNNAYCSKLTELNIKYCDLTKRNLIATIYDQRPDIVHYHWWAELKLPKRHPKLSFSYKKVVTIQQQLPAPLTDVDIYVASSFDNYLKQNHISNNKKTFIPLGINVEDFSDKKIEHDNLVIGRHSTIIPTKLPENIFGIFSQINLPNIKFLIAGVGDESYIEKLKQIHYLEYPHINVEMNTRDPDTKKMLNQIDIYGYMTNRKISESFGLCILEAMASGLPIVADARGGILEQVRNGQEGILCSSSTDFVNACELLGKEEKLREKMGNAARLRAFDFHVINMAYKYRKIYEKLYLETHKSFTYPVINCNPLNIQKIKNIKDKLLYKNELNENIIDNLQKSNLNIDLESIIRKKCLIIAPHPDDEVLGCGGIIQKLNSIGIATKVIYLTDGTMGGKEKKYDIELIKKRKKEVKKSCGILNIKDYEFLNLPDSFLVKNIDKAQVYLLKIINTYKPNTIFIPNILDSSQDHFSSNISLYNCISYIDNISVENVLMYETLEPMNNNIFIDITDEIINKIQALKCHQTQTNYSNIIQKSELISKLNALNYANYPYKRQKNFEGFYKLDIKEYSKVMNELLEKKGKD